MALTPHWRDATRAELARAPYDLLVIGGGIIGAGIANEASRAGLRVALVDRGDFGGATSSASSKLIHGGLRYLRLGDVKLVREAHTERRALLRVVAPHLVRRIPFLFPVYRGGPYRPATIQAGLWTYSTLAGEKLGGLVRPERALRSVPALRLDGLRGCGVYQDAWTHDGRLCLANVTAAAEAGATVMNFAEVVELRLVGREGAGSGAATIASPVTRSRSRPVAVVNATGPWLETMRRLEEPGVAAYGQLSKGVHVTLPLDEPWSAALTIPHDQVRVTFAYPWEGMLLLGTTDTPYEGDPADVTATDEDVDRDPRRGGCGRRLTAAQKANVLSTYAGCGCSRAATAQPWTPVARRHSCRGRAACSRSRAASSRPTGGSRSTRSAACRRSSGSPTSTVGRCRFPAQRMRATSPRASSPAGAWSRRSRRISPTSTAPGPTASSVSRPNGRSSSSGCTPMRRTSLLRSCSPRREEWATSADDVLQRRTSLGARGLPSRLKATVAELLERASEDSAEPRRSSSAWASDRLKRRAQPGSPRPERPTRSRAVARLTKPMFTGLRKRRVTMNLLRLLVLACVATLLLGGVAGAARTRASRFGRAGVHDRVDRRLREPRHASRSWILLAHGRRQGDGSQLPPHGAGGRRQDHGRRGRSEDVLTQPRRREVHVHL